MSLGSVVWSERPRMCENSWAYVLLYGLWHTDNRTGRQHDLKRRALRVDEGRAGPGRTTTSRNVVGATAAARRRRQRYTRCGSRSCSAANALTDLPERFNAAIAARPSSGV